MTLKKYYTNLYSESVEKIREGAYSLDKLIDTPDDQRYGITLLLRPPAEVKEKIALFLREMKEIDPNQYYYPEGDIHITVLSIISCNKNFNIANINITGYADILAKAISETTDFSITFTGVTASPSCIMIQGFPQDNILDNLRDNIRTAFRGSGLVNSIDERYVIKTAHSTVIRFKQDLKNIKYYLEKLESYRDFNFGSFDVTALELVNNDWYMRKENSSKLKTFHLLKTDSE